MDKKKNYGLAWFATQWIIIVGISAYDLYLSVKYSAELYSVELNPLGRYLIELGGGDVSLFMGVKLAGTGLSLGLLALIYRGDKKIAHAIIFPIMILQILLLAYLETGPWFSG